MTVAVFLASLLGFMSFGMPIAFALILTGAVLMWYLQFWDVQLLAQNLLAGGFAGPVWLVNPKHTAIAGHVCHSSITALPSAPDLAILATPPQTIPPLIADLGAGGTRAASPRTTATSSISRRPSPRPTWSRSTG